MKAKVAIGERGMGADIGADDRLAVARLLTHHHGDIDAARVVALDQIFAPVAITDHLEEIAVFEGLQPRHVVGLLQAQDVCVAFGDGERGELARVVGMRDGARLLQPLIFRLASDLEEPQHPILLELVAETAEIEAAHQVLDIEGGDAERHGQSESVAMARDYTKCLPEIPR